MKKLIKEYSCGIEAIEFSIGSSLDQVENALYKYKERMGQLLVNCPISFHGPFLDLAPYSFDSLVREATMRRYEQCYDAAKKLGAKHVIFHTCFQPGIYFPSIWKERTVQFFKEFMSDKDDQIAVHLENVFEQEYSYLLAVIEEVGHKAFSICLDIGHVNTYSNKSIEEWIDALGNSIGHVHIHNNDGCKDTHQPLEKGTIPMARVLGHLSKACPKADWTIEVNSYEDAVASLKYIQLLEHTKDIRIGDMNEKE